MVIFSRGCDALIILALSRASTVAVLATGDSDAGGVSADLLCIAISIGATSRSILDALRFNASLPAWALAIRAALRARLLNTGTVDARLTCGAVGILSAVLGGNWIRGGFGGHVEFTQPLSVAIGAVWTLRIRRTGADIARLEVALSRLYFIALTDVR